MLTAQRSLAARAALVFGAMAVAVQTAFAGILAATEAVTQAVEIQIARNADTYAEAPKARPPVKNPGRDPDRSRIWKGDLRSALIRVSEMRAIDSGQVYASMAPVFDGSTTGGSTGSTTGSNTSGGGITLTSEGAYVTSMNQVDPGGPPTGTGGTNYSGGAQVTNTNTGNLVTPVDITDWPSRGQLSVAFTLFHNSISANQPQVGLGPAWSHAYDVTAAFSQEHNAHIVKYGDGTHVPYTPDGQNGWKPHPGFFEKLTVTSTGYEITTRSQHKLILDRINGSALAYLVEVRDRIGNAVTIVRPTTGDPGHVQEIIDPDGVRKLTFTWQSGLLQSVARTDGQTTSFEYQSGRLWRINYPTVSGQSGLRDVFTYDTAHNILTRTDTRGQVWTYTYVTAPGGGKLETVLAPGTRPAAERTTSFSYQLGKTVITLPDLEVNNGQDTHTIEHHYSNGQLVRIKDEAGFLTDMAYYTANNQLAYVSDARHHEWYFQYDANGNMTSYDPPGFGGMTWSYNATNDVLWSETVRGGLAGNKRTVYTYHTNGLLDSVTDPTDRRLVKIDSHDQYGQPNVVKDGLNRVTDYDFDAQGNLDQVTRPDGTLETFQHSTYGRTTRVTDSAGDWHDVLYDEWDRPYRVNLENGDHARITLDPGGLVTESRDPRGFVTKYAYDAVGNLIERESPRPVDPGNPLLGNFKDTYLYDSRNRLTRWTNGRGKAINYTRAARGELWKLSYPSGGSGMETYRYYATGELAERINGLAQRVKYIRGGAGYILSVDFPAGTPDVTVSHDADGFVSQVVDGTGTTTWTRDLAGRATQLVQPNGTVSHAYDAAGALVTTTETGHGTTTWAYHATNGRLLSVTDGDSQATTFGYDTAGRVDRVTYANGTYEDRAFDALGRLSGLTLRASGGTALRTETMSRLADGRLSSRTVDGQTVSYTYDEVGQLLTETRGGVATAYTYDGNHNRLTKSVGGTVAETYAYSDDDRLLSVTSSAGVRSFDYDNAGRTTAERWQGSVVKTYSWNADDRLTTATGAFGSRSYGYSFSGARASETGGQGRSWLRRGTGVTSPVLRDGVSRYSPGSSVRPIAGGDSSFQHGGWKSFEAQTGPTGTVTGTRQYDAFGAQLGSTGAWQGALAHGGGFGYQTDDTGLQLLGHRYYDPSTGRFLTRDPIKDGPNWYSYCLNDPVNAADPDGRLPVFLFRILFDIVLDLVLDQFFEIAQQFAGRNGTSLHKILGDLVKKLFANTAMENHVHVEGSYKHGRRVRYGTSGSVRADVAIGDKDSPVALIDWKFGKRGMSSGRRDDLADGAFGDRPGGIIVIGKGGVEAYVYPPGKKKGGGIWIPL